MDRARSPQRLKFRAKQSRVQQLGVERYFPVSAVGSPKKTQAARILIPDQFVAAIAIRGHIFGDGVVAHLRLLIRYVRSIEAVAALPRNKV